MRNFVYILLKPNSFQYNVKIFNKVQTMICYNDYSPLQQISYFFDNNMEWQDILYNLSSKNICARSFHKEKDVGMVWHVNCVRQLKTGERSKGFFFRTEIGFFIQINRQTVNRIIHHQLTLNTTKPWNPGVIFYLWFLKGWWDSVPDMITHVFYQSRWYVLLGRSTFGKRWRDVITSIETSPSSSMKQMFCIL